ncbi:MAG: ABC transporter substrate-binding protein [Chloroflexi bacterium]|nr:ABC transporter substrate-binding protein [Chloroflexota bacterium]
MQPKKSFISGSSLAVLALLAAACAPAAAPTPAVKPTAPASKVETPAAKPPAPPPAPSPTLKPTAQGPRYGGILTSWDSIEPEHLDIHQANSGGTLWPMGGVYNGLIQHNPLRPHNIIPELAESWEVSPDGKSWTFNLHEGMKWHDGKPFTAEDVKFSLDRMRDPPRGIVSPRRNLYKAVEKVEPLNARKVRLVLKHPSPSLLPALATGWAVMMPRHVIEARGDMKNEAVGTGPFKFVRYMAGTSLVVEKNKDYFVKGRPYLDGITWYLIKDPSVQFAALRTRRVLVSGYGSSGLTPVQVEVAKREIPGVSVYEYGGGSGQTMVFNVTRPPFNDVRVRQAAVMALDQGEIIKAAVQGGARRTGPLGAPGEWTLPEQELYALPGIRKPSAGDIAEAKRLLAEAGFPSGLKTAFPFRSAARFGEVAQVVQDQVAKVGIDIGLQRIEAAAFPDFQRRRTWDMIQSSHRAGVNDPDEQLGYFVTGSPDNHSGYSDKMVDELYAKQSQTMNPAERKQIVNRLERWLMERVPIFRLFEWTMYVAHWPELKGYEGLETSMNNTRWAHVWLAQ